MNYRDETNNGVSKGYDKFPDCCPHCDTAGIPIFVAAYKSSWSSTVWASFICPAHNCSKMFIASYHLPSGSATMKLQRENTLNFTASAESFSDDIQKLSPDFCKIFNQAHIAETNDLDQIAGPGYRKALEFLVKDFLVGYKYKDDEEKQTTIKKLLLGKCIANHVDEARIQQCAARAAWLGNDETHYMKKWEDKDIGHLKELIKMTAGWIDLVVQSDAYLEEMGQGK
jgi:hypothetical protein